MNERWQKFKGYLAGAVALIACPCHLPITFPLLLSLTAGTALGSWLEGKFALVFAVSAAIFIGGLVLASKSFTHVGRIADQAHQGSRIANPAHEEAITVTLLTSSTCKSCSRAARVWEQVALSHSLQIETVEINSPRGRELAARHNIFTTPATLIGERVVLRGVPTVEKASRLI
jgi:glutaredoxin